MDDGLSDADALPVALRKLADDRVPDAAEGGALDHFIHPFGDIRAGDAFQLRDEGKIIADLHFRIERRGFGQVADVLADVERLLNDIETGHAGFARSRGQEAGEDAHRGGFSGAVLAEKPNDFALADFEGNVFDRYIASVSLGQTFDFDHRGSLNSIV